MGLPTRSGGRKGLLLSHPLLPKRLILGCLRLGSLLIQLLHSLCPLLHRLGLGSLSSRPLLLLLRGYLGLGGRQCLLLRRPVLPGCLVLRCLGLSSLLI